MFFFYPFCLIGAFKLQHQKNCKLKYYDIFQLKGAWDNLSCFYGKESKSQFGGMDLLGERSCTRLQIA